MAARLFGCGHMPFIARLHCRGTFCCFRNENVKKLACFQNASFCVAGKQMWTRLSSSLNSKQARFSRYPHEERRPSLLIVQLRTLNSTRPGKSKIKFLTLATYASIAVGAVLLTLIGRRSYDRFKKRARGIEEIDEPLFGRRSRVFFRYRGYVLPSYCIDTIANDLPWFEVRPDDVWVVSFPKAGTTWVQEIVYLLCTDFDFDKAKGETIEDRFPFLEFFYPGMKAVAEKASPRFIKTHVPISLLPKQFDEKKPKVLYIARNPKDTVISLQAFTKLVNVVKFTGTTEDFANLFLDGKAFYGPWVKHVQEGWEHRNDDNVLFLTYEDLKKDFRGTVLSIAKFLGKPVTENQLRQLEEHCSFRSMQSNNAVNYTWNKDMWGEGQFMRKGEVGDWKNHLSPEMSSKFDSMCRELEEQGLQFVDS